MNVFQMRDTLKQRLKHLDVDFKFDREEETLRIYRRDNFKRRNYQILSSCTVVAVWNENH